MPPTTSATVGILALQGAVEPHAEKLSALGATVVRVRRAEHLENLSGLVLPGGESSTMLHLIGLKQMWEPLAKFFAAHPAFGICAGAILLAKTVTNPDQKSFAVVDVEIERNAWGRQTESFAANLSGTDAYAHNQEGVFIRAPKIRAVGGIAKVLLTCGSEAVCVEDGKHLVATFHPELSEGTSRLHKRFLESLGHKKER